MKPKILVVDDHEQNRYLLEALMKGSGFQAVAAVDGVDALEKLRGAHFDLIITDILMPNMDGYQLCRECKADDQLKDIPFLFYTATYTDDKDEQLSLAF